jgi:hypothetical protein
MASGPNLPNWVLSPDLLAGLYSSEPTALDKGLDAVFDQVITYYADAYNWYNSKKGPFRLRARFARAVGIVGTALATLWPVLHLVGWTSLLASLIPQTGPDPVDAISAVGQLGYVFAAIGSVALLVDVYAGYSTSWMRFVQAAQMLQKSGSIAQAGYAKLIADQATAEQKSAFIVQSMTSLWTIVGNETASWAQDYQQDMTKLSDQLNTITAKQVPQAK